MALAFLLLVILSTLLLLMWGICTFLIHYFWKSQTLRAVMDKQGIPGPPYPVNLIFDLLHGKRDMEEISHDILPQVSPWMAINFKLFGRVHLNWWIREPRIVIVEPRMIWDLLLKRHRHFRKSHVISLFSDDIFHKGIFLASGQAWAKQRRLVAPTLYIDKVKTMIEAMDICTRNVMQKWGSLVKEDEGREIDVQIEFMTLNVDIIARAAFSIVNNNSKRIVHLILTLLDLQDEQETWSWLPFARWLPVKVNIERRTVRRELHELVGKQVRERKKSGPPYGADVLGVMLDNQTEMSEELIIAECKTLYGTGFLSLAPLLSYTMLMLAKYPTWQEKAREEVDKTLGAGSGGRMDAEALSRLEIVEMILRETMRLYPTMPFITRVCVEDTMLGDVFIPKGLGVTVPVLAVHHDAKLWGKDVLEFNPYRFQYGTTAAAKHPIAFMPFSFGSRTCIGRAFSEVQCKVVIANILQCFVIKLSPNYRHHPWIPGPMIPKYGMPVILEKRSGCNR